jgi:hypothetical protein
LDVHIVSGDRDFATEVLAVEQKDAAAADHDMVDVAPTIVLVAVPVGQVVEEHKTSPT